MPETRPARVRTRRAAVCVGAALGLAASFAFASTSASATTAPTLQSVKVAGYSSVLAGSTARTLYLLNIEKGAKLHCKTKCLSLWLPVLVKSSVKSVTIGTGVKGKIGFVSRSSSHKQVTFNSYPVYSYTGDSGPRQEHGEDVMSFGGAWKMLKVSATTAASTPDSPQLQSENLSGYTGTLANSARRSFYVLSTEVGASVQCTGSCLSIWPPFEVTSTTAPVTLGPGVKGTVGFVSRGTSLYQVTFNSYPVYTYSGDSGPGGSNGQALVEFGGTWYLTNASATMASTTQIVPYTYPYARSHGH